MSKATQSAKVREQAEQIEKLGKIIAKLLADQRRTNALLCAVLQQYHGGRADLNRDLALTWANNLKGGISFTEFKELGILRVTAEQDVSQQTTKEPEKRVVLAE